MGVKTSRSLTVHGPDVDYAKEKRARVKSQKEEVRFHSNGPDSLILKQTLLT